MQLTRQNRFFQTGFSLVEMAVVLAIVAFLLSGLLPTISGQVAQQRMNETRKQMEEIRSAMLGFAMANGRLPCPDTDTPPDGNENIAAPTVTNNVPQTGQSTKIFLCSSQGGGLPFNQLGTLQLDNYNSAYIYRVASAFSEKDEIYSALNATGTLLNTTYFTLSSTGNLKVCSATNNAATSPCPTPRLIDNAAAVIVSKGSNWANTPSVEETENTDNDNDFVSHDPTPTFDDLVVWLSPNTLFNRMVAAGKLP